jgi:hypothetical protein
VKKVFWLIGLASILSNLGYGQSKQKVALGITSITGITSSWPGECAAGVIDNRSVVARYNYYHSLLMTTSSGNWTAALNYSDTSCAGPWTTFGSSSSISQASNPAIAIGLGYHPYIQVAITGNVTVTYAGQNQLPIALGGGGGVSFPITVPQGGTGLSSFTANCLLYGNGTSQLNCLAPGTQYQVYQANVSGAPILGPVNLNVNAAVTGNLGVTHGGTGAGAFNTNGMLFGNNTAAIGSTSAGSQYNVFQAGASGVPTVGPLHLDQSAAVTGILPVVSGGTGTASPGLIAGSGITVSGSWPNQTINSTAGGGSVTSVGMTVPSWLSVSGSPITTSGAFGVTAATGQASHNVVGTCGTATSVSLCPLQVSDLPINYPYTSLAGAPTIYNQSLLFGGIAATQRPSFNLIAGTNVGITCVDNSGSNRTDCTFSATGGGGGSSLSIQNNGVTVGTEPLLNFIAGSGMSQTIVDTGTAINVTLTQALPSILTVTTTYAVAATDNTILCDATAAGFTSTLPASPTTGKVYSFKKIDASGNTCTLSSNGKNIDGAASYATSTQYASVQIQYNGTTWYVIASH